MPRKSKKHPDFESALTELEALVEQMEAGDITLEESLKLFERGVTLTSDCQQALQGAQQKVEILLQKTERAQAEEFETDV